MKKNPIDSALKHFTFDYNCAQSVLAAILEHENINIPQASNVAAGFGGGISFSGQQCGAVSGAIMAIGVIVGQSESDTDKQKSETYRLSESLISGFRKEFGTIRCDNLTGIKMSNKETLNKAIDDGFFGRTCPKFLKWCVQAVLDLTSQ